MKISTEAMQASSSVIRITPMPLFFSVDRRKNSPTLKAMKASAMSEMKSMPSMICAGIRSRQ